MKHAATCICLALLVISQVLVMAQQPAPTVAAASKDSLIKIDGRFFVGLFSSEADGTYENRAIDVPDTKLRFTFVPGTNVTVVNRFSNNKGTTNGFDYFYLDLKNWGGALPGHMLRVGKVKIDVGLETWTDNPVENIVITNSAAAVSGYDAGLQFLGTVPVSVPTTYALGIYNGTGSLGSATRGLAGSARVTVAPVKQLALSASYYDSGDLVQADGTVTSPALKVANLQSVPAGITGWKRSVMEVDARWNYGPTGIKSVISSTPEPARFQVGVALGRFKDDFTGSADRKGTYGYVEGLYNATDKLYLASRLSQVTLSDDATAKLAGSPVAVNKYQRVSLGAGYHLTPLTDVKAEYTINSTDGGASEPELNQVAIGLATKL